MESSKLMCASRQSPGGFTWRSLRSRSLTNTQRLSHVHNTLLWTFNVRKFSHFQKHDSFCMLQAERALNLVSGPCTYQESGLVISVDLRQVEETSISQTNGKASAVFSSPAKLHLLSSRSGAKRDVSLTLFHKLLY